MLKAQGSSGSRIRLVPPTSAQRVLLELDRMVSHARCRAAVELEQAVSVVNDGPRRFLRLRVSLWSCLPAHCLLTGTS